MKKNYFLNYIKKQIFLKYLFLTFIGLMNGSIIYLHFSLASEESSNSNFRIEFSNEEYLHDSVFRKAIELSQNCNNQILNLTQIVDTLNKISEKTSILCSKTDLLHADCFEGFITIEKQLENIFTTYSSFYKQCSFSDLSKLNNTILSISNEFRHNSSILIENIITTHTTYSQAAEYCLDKIEIAIRNILSLQLNLNNEILNKSSLEVLDIYQIENLASQIIFIQESIHHSTFLCSKVLTEYQERMQTDISNTIAIFDDALDSMNSVVTESLEDYRYMKFKEFLPSICLNLSERKLDFFDLCKTPLNNPSWFYSIHFLTKDQKNQTNQPNQTINHQSVLVL